MTGSIDKATFLSEGSTEATVTVSAYHEIEETLTEYTRVVVLKNSDGSPAVFTIYWLVPDREYYVVIDFDPSVDTDDYVEEIDPADIGPGVVFSLNNGDPI